MKFYSPLLVLQSYLDYSFFYTTHLHDLDSETYPVQFQSVKSSLSLHSKNFLWDSEQTFLSGTRHRNRLFLCNVIDNLIVVKYIERLLLMSDVCIGLLYRKLRMLPYT